MPDITEVFNRRLDRNTLARLRAEDARTLRVYRLLEQSRREMYNRLLAFEAQWGTTEAYTPAYLSRAIQDITNVMERFRIEATGIVADGIYEGFDLGQIQTFDEIRVFEDFGGFAPQAPIDTVFTLVESNTAVLREMTTRLTTIVNTEIQRTAMANGADAAALLRAGASTEEIKNVIARGIIEGKGTQSIARRLMAPSGEFPRLSNATIMRTVRLSINDAFNEGHDTTIRKAKAVLPDMQRQWFSARVRSTPICLHLHGQVRDLGESFQHGEFTKDRPPAIGNGATPKFHLCRSRVIPYRANWPENPKTRPLTPAEIEDFKNGGGPRAVDIAQKKNYPGFTPAARGAKQELRRGNEELGVD